MSDVPRGNTQKNVNDSIYKYFYRWFETKESLKILDMPCGENVDWLQFLHQKYPLFELTGYDLKIDPQILHLTKSTDPHKSSLFLAQQTSAQTLKTSAMEKYDLITCISGVMCFDGHEELFQYFYKALQSEGFLAVSNDNIMTVRDRLQFLFFGSFKRFPLVFQTQEGNWNVMLPQGLLMLGRRAGFKPVHIHYCSMYWEDLLFVPLALLLYPLLWWQAFKGSLKSNEPFGKKLFSFRSLLARHYIIYFKRP